MTHIIENSCRDIYFNLAAEEYLLKKQGGDSYIMVWQADPVVVVGKNQSVSIEVDDEYAASKGIRVARRYSGGGAVYHDEGNVNLTFIDTNPHPRFETYTERTLAFLREIGLDAYIGSRLAIFVQGWKVSGSAQVIYKDRVLYHCTLLYWTDLMPLYKVLKGGVFHADYAKWQHSTRAVPSARSDVANICSYLRNPVTLKRFIRLLVQYFQAETDGQMYCFSPEDIAAIEQLKREKYEREEWVMDRLQTCPNAQ